MPKVSIPMGPEVRVLSFGSYAELAESSAEEGTRRR